jgi:hypothetical protein
MFAVLAAKLQDYAFFIPPPPYYTGKLSRFSPSIDECWYGRVALVFKIHVRKDYGTLMACTCAMMETLWDYCPRESKQWWQNTAQIGSKMLCLPKPSQYVWIVPITWGNGLSIRSSSGAALNPAFGVAMKWLMCLH